MLHPGEFHVRTHVVLVALLNAVGCLLVGLTARHHMCVLKPTLMLVIIATNV